MSRIGLFIRYLKNNRIKEYETIIQTALRENYEVISLRDYILENFESSKKLLILRHDVDHFSGGTRAMFEVEQQYGAKSSFYFRNKTFEPKLMQEIEAYGSEASLHFEPIADFVKANNIKSKDELEGFKNWQERCLNILKADLDRFRNLLDIPCLTIASHGEYENSLVKTPNNYLTEDISTYDDLGIKLEAYNREFIKRVTCYISDVPIEINGGYRYGVTPLEAIEKKEEMILFLTHPNHWHYSPWKQFKKLVKVVLKGGEEKAEEFQRI